MDLLRGGSASADQAKCRLDEMVESARNHFHHEAL
jgi:hypothetical protein